MSKDKTILVLLSIIAVASFCGGMFLLERIEKDGWFQGQSTWQYLNKQFRVLLVEAEKKSERNHSETQESQAIHARLLHNVGTTCGYTDQWSDSLKHLNLALDYKIKNKAVTSESLIRSMESLGKAYYLIGNYDCARTTLDFAARDWVRESGEDCKPYAGCLCATGRVNLAMGNLKAAEFCFEKAKSIFKKEEDRSWTARAILYLAECSMERGDLKSTQDRISDAIPFLKDDLGSDYRSHFNDEVALLNYLQGQIMLNSTAGKSNSDAENLRIIDGGIDLIKEGAKEFYVSLGEDDVYSQKIRLALANAYLKKNNKTACLSELTGIETSFERIGLPNHPFLRKVYDLHLKAIDGEQKTLIDAIQTKLSAVQPMSSSATMAEAGKLGARLNPSPKFLQGRNFTDPWMLPLTLQIVAWVFSGMFACAMACAAQAARKDYTPSVWFILGVILNFVALLIVCVLPSRSTFSKELGCDFAIINDARSGVFLLSASPLLCILFASIFYYPSSLRDIFIAAFLAICVCLIFFPPIWCFAIAGSKGLNQLLWGLIGLVTGIFGLVFLLLLKPGDNCEIDEEESRNTQSESAMLLLSLVHIALFFVVVANIYFSWMLHIEI